MSFNRRKFASHNKLIPKYASTVKYLSSFPYFIFTYLYRAIRLFTDEFSVKVLR